MVAGMTVNHLAKPRGVRLTQLPLYMVFVAEWFRRKIVVLVYGGSIPFEHPITGFVVES